MMPVDEENINRQETDYVGGLTCGLGPKHIKILCDNPWNGGLGYHPNQVAEMSLDQILMSLADKKYLRAGGRMRTVAMAPLELKTVEEDGSILGRDENGNLMKAKISGKSLARKLMEQEQQKELERKKKKRKRKRQ